MGTAFREDICRILSQAHLPWPLLDHSVVFVTGGTGSIGGALVRALAQIRDELGLSLRILAGGRNLGRGEKLARETGAVFLPCDVRDRQFLSTPDTEVTYWFHCAAVTASARMIEAPVEVVATALAGTRNVLELARKHQSKGVVFLSSMEVYGQLGGSEVRETDLGYLDLAAARSCYPESKRMSECLGSCYHAQYGVPVKQARLAQAFGAGTLRGDPRVFAQFARSAMAGEDLLLHTDGSSRGNYCYLGDAVEALLFLLLHGQSGQAYNIANPEASMTIRQMALLVAEEVCGGRLSVRTEIPPDPQRLGYAAPVGFRLNIDKMRALGWAPRHGMAEMYRRMLADWQQDDDSYGREPHAKG